MEQEIAQRIAELHNAFRMGGLCRGVLLFSPQGWEPRWRPEQWGARADRIIVAVADHDLEGEEVLAAITEQKNALAHASADRERQLLKTRASQGVRRQGEGFRHGSFNCFSCKRFKPRPSSVCGYCGDDPVPINGDRRDFDAGYGYDYDERMV